MDSYSLLKNRDPVIKTTLFLNNSSKSKEKSIMVNTKSIDNNNSSNITNTSNVTKKHPSQIYSLYKRKSINLSENAQNNNSINASQTNSVNSSSNSNILNISHNKQSSYSFTEISDNLKNSKRNNNSINLLNHIIVKASSNKSRSLSKFTNNIKQTSSIENGDTENNPIIISNTSTEKVKRSNIVAKTPDISKNSNLSNHSSLTSSNTNFLSTSNINNFESININSQISFFNNKQKSGNSNDCNKDKIRNKRNSLLIEENNDTLEEKMIDNNNKYIKHLSNVKSMDSLLTTNSNKNSKALNDKAIMSNYNHNNTNNNITNNVKPPKNKSCLISKNQQMIKTTSTNINDNKKTNINCNTSLIDQKRHNSQSSIKEICLSTNKNNSMKDIQIGNYNYTNTVNNTGNTTNTNNTSSNGNSTIPKNNSNYKLKQQSVSLHDKKYNEYFSPIKKHNTIFNNITNTQGVSSTNTNSICFSSTNSSGKFISFSNNNSTKKEKRRNISSNKEANYLEISENTISSNLYAKDNNKANEEKQDKQGNSILLNNNKNINNNHSSSNTKNLIKSLITNYSNNGNYNSLNLSSKNKYKDTQYNSNNKSNVVNSYAFNNTHTYNSDSQLVLNLKNSKKNLTGLGTGNVNLNSINSINNINVKSPSISNNKIINNNNSNIDNTFIVTETITSPTSNYFPINTVNTINTINTNKTNNTKNSSNTTTSKNTISSNGNKPFKNNIANIIDNLAIKQDYKENTIKHNLINLLTDSDIVLNKNSNSSNINSSDKHLDLSNKPKTPISTVARINKKISNSQSINSYSHSQISTIIENNLLLNSNLFSHRSEKSNGISISQNNNLTSKSQNKSNKQSEEISDFKNNEKNAVTNSSGLKSDHKINYFSASPLKQHNSHLNCNNNGNSNNARVNSVFNNKDDNKNNLFGIFNKNKNIKKEDLKKNLKSKGFKKPEIFTSLEANYKNTKGISAGNNSNTTVNVNSNSKNNSMSSNIIYNKTSKNNDNINSSLSNPFKTSKESNINNINNSSNSKSASSRITKLNRLQSCSIPSYSLNTKTNTLIVNQNNSNNSYYSNTDNINNIANTSSSFFTRKSKSNNFNINNENNDEKIKLENFDTNAFKGQNKSSIDVSQNTCYINNEVFENPFDIPRAPTNETAKFVEDRNLNSSACFKDSLLNNSSDSIDIIKNDDNDVSCININSKKQDNTMFNEYGNKNKEYDNNNAMCSDKNKEKYKIDVIDTDDIRDTNFTSNNNDNPSLTFLLQAKNIIDDINSTISKSKQMTSREENDIFKFVNRKLSGSKSNNKINSNFNIHMNNKSPKKTIVIKNFNSLNPQDNFGKKPIVSLSSDYYSLNNSVKEFYYFQIQEDSKTRISKYNECLQYINFSVKEVSSFLGTIDSEKNTLINECLNTNSSNTLINDSNSRNLSMLEKEKLISLENYNKENHINVSFGSNIDSYSNANVYTSSNDTSNDYASAFNKYYSELLKNNSNFNNLNPIQQQQLKQQLSPSTINKSININISNLIQTTLLKNNDNINNSNNSSNNNNSTNSNNNFEITTKAIYTSATKTKNKRLKPKYKSWNDKNYLKNNLNTHSLGIIKEDMDESRFSSKLVSKHNSKEKDNKNHKKKNIKDFHIKETVDKAIKRIKEIDLNSREAMISLNKEMLISMSSPANKNKKSSKQLSIEIKKNIDKMNNKKMVFNNEDNEDNSNLVKKSNYSNSNSSKIKVNTLPCDYGGVRRNNFKLKSLSSEESYEEVDIKKSFIDLTSNDENRQIHDCLYKKDDVNKEKFVAKLDDKLHLKILENNKIINNSKVNTNEGDRIYEKNKLLNKEKERVEIANCRINNSEDVRTNKVEVNSDNRNKIDISKSNKDINENINKIKAKSSVSSKSSSSPSSLSSYESSEEESESGSSSVSNSKSSCESEENSESSSRSKNSKLKNTNKCNANDVNTKKETENLKDENSKQLLEKSNNKSLAEDSIIDLSQLSNIEAIINNEYIEKEKLLNKNTKISKDKINKIIKTSLKELPTSPELSSNRNTDNKVIKKNNYTDIISKYTSKIIENNYNDDEETLLAVITQSKIASASILSDKEKNKQRKDAYNNNLLETKDKISGINSERKIHEIEGEKQLITKKINSQRESEINYLTKKLVNEFGSAEKEKDRNCIVY